jgi:hypothetical protein
MALQKTLKKTIAGYEGELIAENVEFVVRSVTGEKFNAVAVVKGVANGVEVYSKPHSFTPDMDGPNFIKQAYQHLKTLPEFEGAVDC